VDPISLIVAAVVAGAAAGLKESAADAVKDAFTGLKRLIFERHGVDVTPVERKPESESKRDSLKEDLADTGAADDPELRAAAQRLIAAVAEHDASAAQAVGVDLEDVRAGFIQIGDVDVRGPGTGVRGERVDVAGGIVIGNVRTDAGGGTERP
jgi:hypothetical protein